MTNVDVEIYISQLKTFFTENKEQLYKLIGNADSEEFFDEVKKVSLKNHESGDDVQLTQKQLIDVILKVTKNETKTQKKKNIDVIVPYVMTKFGKIYLN